jgi:hypothetical protein
VSASSGQLSYPSLGRCVRRRPACREPSVARCGHLYPASAAGKRAARRRQALSPNLRGATLSSARAEAEPRPYHSRQGVERRPSWRGDARWTFKGPPTTAETREPNRESNVARSRRVCRRLMIMKSRLVEFVYVRCSSLATTPSRRRRRAAAVAVPPEDWSPSVGEPLARSCHLIAPQ